MQQGINKDDAYTSQRSRTYYLLIESLKVLGQGALYALGSQVVIKVLTQKPTDAYSND
jgi:hypothetical protein